MGVEIGKKSSLFCPSRLPARRSPEWTARVSKRLGWFIVPYTNLPSRGLTGGAVEDRINYFERMLADNPDNPTGLLALANEYEKAGRDEDEAAVLERYLAVHVDDEGNAYARL